MRFTTVLAALLFSASLSAQQLEIDRAASAMMNMEAGFAHSFTPKGFKNAQTERGSVVFGTLPKMRWSYTSPEKKTFVFDGTQSWFYVPADNQVTMGRITDDKRRELPFLLLGDPAARGRSFVVKEKTQKGSVVTTLQPRDSRAMIRSVSVTIAPSTHLIQHIDYTDREGNHTSFDFSGYHRASASAATFRFDPPAGVQIVHAD